MFKECSDLLRKYWTVKLKHVFRECNQATDMLVNLSLELDNEELKEWIYPPSKVVSILKQEAWGVLWTRRVCCTALLSNFWCIELKNRVKK